MGRVWWGTVRRWKLFRWWKRFQFDVEWGGGWISLGLDRRRWPWRVVAYWSPDATPTNEKARGWGAVR